MNTDSYAINVQFATNNKKIPKRALLRSWAKRALSRKMDKAEVTLRVVNVDEMTQLNSTYRHKQGATNVLSFPMSFPEEITMAMPILGDIVICAEIVNQEAEQQQKLPEAHWAHMTIHGVLHLLGYDHESDKEALVMESLEVEILHDLGFANPYL